MSLLLSLIKTSLFQDLSKTCRANRAGWALHDDSLGISCFDCPPPGAEAQKYVKDTQKQPLITMSSSAQKMAHPGLALNYHVERTPVAVQLSIGGRNELKS